MKIQPTKKQQPQIIADLASIAKEVFGVPTLNERGNDSLDFHDGISVHDISRALEAAYMAGRKDAMREASEEAVQHQSWQNNIRQAQEFRKSQTTEPDA